MFLLDQPVSREISGTVAARGSTLESGGSPWRRHQPADQPGGPIQRPPSISPTPTPDLAVSRSLCDLDVASHAFPGRGRPFTSCREFSHHRAVAGRPPVSPRNLSHACRLCLTSTCWGPRSATPAPSHPRVPRAPCMAANAVTVRSPQGLRDRIRRFSLSGPEHQCEGSCFQSRAFLEHKEPCQPVKGDGPLLPLMLDRVHPGCTPELGGGGLASGLRAGLRAPPRGCPPSWKRSQRLWLALFQFLGPVLSPPAFPASP